MKNDNFREEDNVLNLFMHREDYGYDLGSVPKTEGGINSWWSSSNGFGDGYGLDLADSISGAGSGEGEGTPWGFGYGDISTFQSFENPSDGTWYCDTDCGFKDGCGVGIGVDDHTFHEDFYADTD